LPVHPKIAPTRSRRDGALKVNINAVIAGRFYILYYLPRREKSGAVAAVSPKLPFVPTLS